MYKISSCLQTRTEILLILTQKRPCICKCQSACIKVTKTPWQKWCIVRGCTQVLMHPHVCRPGSTGCMLVRTQKIIQIFDPQILHETALSEIAQQLICNNAAHQHATLPPTLEVFLKVNFCTCAMTSAQKRQAGISDAADLKSACCKPLIKRSIFGRCPLLPGPCLRQPSRCSLLMQELLQ